MATTIQIEEKVKSKLDKLKVHPRESYNEVIHNLIIKNKTEDIESLNETIEILSDANTMRELAEALEDFKAGKGKTLEQVKAELGID